MNSQRIKGVVLILCAAVLWGTTGTAQTFAPLTLSSYWVGTLRLLVAGGFFLMWLGIRETDKLSAAKLTLLPWKTIFVAAVSMAVYNLAFFAGIRATSVSIGTALALGSGPLWAGALQAVYIRQTPSAAWWLAVAVAIVGLAIAAISSATTLRITPAGVLLCLLSGAAYAVYAIAAKKIVSQFSATLTTAAIFIVAALCALPVVWIIVGPPQLRMADLLVMLWLGIAATGVAYLLFSVGLKYVSTATGVALALGEPVAAVGFAVMIVGERPGLMSLIGLSFLLLGLALLIRGEMRSS